VTFLSDVNVNGSITASSATFTDLNIGNQLEVETLLIKDPTTENYIEIVTPTLTNSYSFTLPVDGGSDGQFLTTDGNGTTSWTDAITAPGGNNTNIQFNDSGTFGGSDDFVWDNANSQLSINGSVTATTATFNDVDVTNLTASGSVTGQFGSFENLELSGDIITEVLKLSDANSNFFTEIVSPNLTESYTFTLPINGGEPGQVLSTDGNGTTTWTDVVTDPGGNNTNIQFNDSGTFGGSDDFVWDNANSRLGIGVSSPSYTLDANGVINSGNGSEAGAFALGNGVDNNKLFLTSKSGGSESITFSLPNDYGVSGRALVTDGSGDLNWSTVDFVPQGIDRSLQFNDNGTFSGSEYLFIDESNSFFGIGIQDPEVQLHVLGEGAQTAQFRLEQYNNSTDAPDIRSFRARGTAASPQAVVDGDLIFRFNAEAYDGNNFGIVGQMRWDAVSDDADDIEFGIQTNSGGSSQDRFGVTGSGEFFLGDQDMIFPTADGIDGQVLTTDGAGNVDWADPLAGNDFVTDVAPGNPANRLAFYTGSNSINSTSISYEEASGDVTFLSNVNIDGSLVGNAATFTDLDVTNLTASGSVTAQYGSFENLELSGDIITEVLKLNDENSNFYTEIVSPNLTESYTFTLPLNGGSPGQVLSTDGNGTTTWTDVITDPGGNNTNIQFNDSGTFGGSDDFSWDNTNSQLNINGNVTATSATFDDLDVVGEIRAGSENTSGTIMIQDATTDFYSAFMANSSATANSIYTLPPDVGISGEALVTDGNGNLTWDLPANSAWRLAGNDITSAPNSFIGTTSNNNVNFRVNNTQLMYFNASNTSTNFEKEPTTNSGQVNAVATLDFRENNVTPGTSRNIFNSMVYGNNGATGDQVAYLASFDTQAGGGGATYENMYGYRSRLLTNGGNAVSIENYVGFENFTTNTGGNGIDNFYGFRNAPTNLNITNQYGFYSELGGGGTDNYYGVYIDDASAATNGYAFFYNGSSSTVVIDENSRIGVGTTSPTTALDVASGTITTGDATTAGALSINNGSGNFVYLDAPTGIGTDFGLTLPNNSGTAGFVLASDGNGNMYWTDQPTLQEESINVSGTDGGLVYNNSGTLTTSNVLSLDEDFSRLGIGTTTPDYPLDVVGIINTGNNTVQGGLAIGNGTDANKTFLLSSAGGSPTFTLPNNTGTNGDYLTSDGSGNLSWSSPSVQDEDVTIQGSTNGLLYNNSGTMTTSSFINVGSNSFLGLGTETPEQPIDVHGLIKSGEANSTDGGLQLESASNGESAYILPNSAATESVTFSLPPDNGTNGQVLVTDGNGNLTWSSDGGTAAEGNTGNIQFNNSGTFQGSDDLFWDNGNSRLGIGDATPDHSLDIEDGDLGVGSTGNTGTINLHSGTGNNTTSLIANSSATTTTAYILPAEDGANGEFLSTDGAGNLSWESAGSSDNRTIGGVDSPGSISTDQNNYDIDETQTYIRIDATGNFDLTGLDATGVVDGQTIVIVNIGTGKINIRNQSTNSTAANRIITGGGNITLNTDGSVTLWYDATSQRWRVKAAF
jgi:hypothetical protein